MLNNKNGAIIEEMNQGDWDKIAKRIIKFAEDNMGR